MADHNSGIPRRKPLPRSAQPLPEGWAADLTAQFRRTLSTKRMNELNGRPGVLRRRSRRNPTELVVRATPSPVPTSHVPTGALNQHPQPASSISQSSDTATSLDASISTPSPPTYSSLRHIPTVPTPPNDPKSIRFRSMLLSYSNLPTKWENPGLLDEALRVIPLQRIYDEAQEEADTFKAEAASLGENIRAAWGYQDCVVRALMKWFKTDFFEWVSNPKCSTCRSQTISQGFAAPLPDESGRGANRVELYQCSNQLCQSFERFPRYNDAFVLLQTRRGRVGEWANCFTMLCRAIDSRARLVWNSEDHVWTEVYSAYRRRWVHVDCCEGVWDQPLLYTEGWKKKLAYCIAFSNDGCQDVTRRYVRNPAEHALPRTRCSEGVLMHILSEIKAMRRRNMDKQERFRLNAEDMKEDAELRKMIIETLAYNVSRILPSQGSGITSNKRPRPDPDAQKAAESRQNVLEMRRNQATQPQPQPPHDQHPQ